MRISEFARALGISPDTVRRLEERGVFRASRDWAGHRRYTEDDVARARATLFGEGQARSTRRSRDPRTIRPRQG